MIRFTCPTCKGILQSAGEKAGEKVACPKCGQRLVVPNPIKPAASDKNKTVLGTLLPSLAKPKAEQSSSASTSTNDGTVNVTCPCCGRLIPLQRHELSTTIQCARCLAPFNPASFLAAQSPAGSRPDWLADVREAENLSSQPHFQGPPTDGCIGMDAPESPRSEQDIGRKQLAGGFVRCALACAGALLLLIGQFCPMLKAPSDVTVTFFDYSMKAAWLLSKAALEAMDNAAQDSDPRQRSWERTRFEGLKSDDHSPSKPSDGVRVVALGFGLVLTLISPFCPVILVVIAVLVLRAAMRELGQTAMGGIRARMLTIDGVLCLATLGILYIGPMLVLWAIPGVLTGIALGVVSFGFGWGVLLLGSLLLLVGGAIR